MAFTEAQKVQIRKYLGYPDLFRSANTRLESAIEVVGGRPETQAEVESILAKLAALQERIDGQLATAGIKQVDEIEFFENASLLGLLSHGRMLCGNLSTLFGIPIASDPFGSGGYAGDWFMGAAFRYGGGLMSMG